MNARARSIRPWPTAAAVAAFLAASFLVAGDPVDDAGITFRFARNLAAGQGLCFNPGQPVEGYVHFLWIVLLAAVERGTGIEPMAAGPELGRLFGALAVIWTALVAARLPGPRSGRARGRFETVAPWLLATNLYFLLWAQAGLETPLFAWLVLVSLHLYLRGGRAATAGAPLALVALCLTRPEGVLVALALAAGALRRRPRLDLRAVRVALTFLVPGGAYFLWRWHYFGHFLPNVFYAKAHKTPGGGAAGWLYLKAFLLRQEPTILLPAAAGWLVLALTIGPGLVALRRGPGPRGRMLLLLVLLWVAAVVAEGGDGMGGFRFFVPVLPLCALLAGVAAERLAAGRSLEKGLALGLLAAPLAFNLANGALYAAEPPTSRHRTWFHQRAYYDDMTRWVQAHVRPGALLALGDVGYIPYGTPDRRYIDFLGLVDPFVAHIEGGILNPEVYRYLYRQRPDYFLSLVHRRPDGRRRGHTPVDQSMLAFLDPGLPPEKRLFRKVAEIEGWIEDGETVSFYVYKRMR